MHRWRFVLVAIRGAECHETFVPPTRIFVVTLMSSSAGSVCRRATLLAQRRGREVRPGPRKRRCPGALRRRPTGWAGWGGTPRQRAEDDVGNLEAAGGGISGSVGSRSAPACDCWRLAGVPGLAVAPHADGVRTGWDSRRKPRPRRDCDAAQRAPVRGDWIRQACRRCS